MRLVLFFHVPLSQLPSNHSITSILQITKSPIDLDKRLEISDRRMRHFQEKDELPKDHTGEGLCDEPWPPKISANI